jgi:acetyltransferase
MRLDAPSSPIPEPVHDVTRARPQPLTHIFDPSSVAVIGASEREGSVGRRVYENLLATDSTRPLFAVNPARDSVLGHQAYPTIAAIGQPVDLAVVITPAPSVPDVIAQCAGAGVKGAIIISAGFREVGAAGAALEAEILAAARPSGMRIVGPNCFGIMSPAVSLNATFSRAPANAGNLGFASQSGALGSAILDWSIDQGFGFSRFISVGSMLDVGWADILYYLGDDPQTKSIVAYMESVGDARSFMSAAREVALVKPIIVIKAGRSEAGAHAAASHTGALTGSDAVLDAAFVRCGVLRVQQIEDLFLMSEALARQPRPRGKRLSILTNAGGPGVLAADELVSGGGVVAPLGKDTMRALCAALPAEWSRGNPVDILGDADGPRYAAAMSALASDDATDGILVIFAPQGISGSEDIAASLRPYATQRGKPVLASWIGGASVASGDAILRQAGIPTLPYPDAAARTFNHMWRYEATQQSLYETPIEEEEGGIDRAAARAIIERALSANRTLLTEAESKALLAAYGIPTVPTRVATSPADAARAAAELGFPVAVKLHSYTVTHKSDLGGVMLDVPDGPSVERAYAQIEDAVGKSADPSAFAGVTVQPMMPHKGYELIMGSSIDLQFGPVLLFGLGGTLVEVFQDRALGLPPLTSTLAHQMMERTKIFQALERGRRSTGANLEDARGHGAVDIAQLEQTLIRFSRLVTEQRRINEFDVNPLLVSSDRIVALDARVVLNDRSIPDSALPKAAIRPYPRQYEGEWSASDGTRVAIRPIRPDDEPLLREFHTTLSESSVYRRYAHVVKLSERVSHERLIRACFIDYDREMALLGLVGSAIVGVGRLIKARDDAEAEFALVVSDAYQHHGIGSELLRRLVDIGRAEQVGRIVGHILAENGAMLRVCTGLGFRITYQDDALMVDAVLDLH